MTLNMISFLWTIFIILLQSTLLLCVKNKIECGYKQCPPTRDGALNVHLIAHSHMDAGWVKTFDEYYYGTKTSVSSANVQLIFHSVLSELLHDKRRKFTFSETAFFWRWWKEQRPATRATFRSLVQEGRVEFAGGGWTHADSATVSYLQTLDLMTWGLRKLNDTLGPCGKPKAAWQIDTYGHTREQASLLAQMGFDGLFLGRVDYKEREEMMEEDRMEFMWRGSDVLGKMSDIMSHALFNLYNAPNGFCFDWLCGDEPLVDDIDSPAYNADARVNEFISQIERQAKYYEHDNILVTMGGDFTYQNAANWFMNMDKLINHVNTHPANLSDINIFYSTPSCYLKAIYLYGRRDKAVYTERGDFLPYGSDSSTYWTGYYTSRPSVKYLAKRVHVFLQVLKQISVITRSGDSYELHLLRHAMALMLHHDAITGTSQQHVSNDFVKILSEAMDSATKKLSNLLSYLTPTWGGSRRSKNSQQFVMCHELNISQCLFAENQESLLVLVYNPLSVKTYHYVRLPAIALHYSIRDFNDEDTEYQLNSLPSSIINLPGRASNSIQELWFEAENVPPLGYTAYYITPVRDQLEENLYKKSSSNPDSPAAELTSFISNEYLKVSINKDTGLLESVQHVDGVRIQISQNFHSYSQGRQVLQSGAYSFRPEQQRPAQVTDRAQYVTVKGALVKEIRQRFTDWISQVIRVYRGEEMVELEWTVGPIPIGADLGKEVVSIFKTNITNGGEFFTDSNGRQMMKRTCWNETALQQQKKPVPACYFPVTSRVCINSHNGSATLCVLTDRAQGGTSYSDGEIELMVHRRLLTDDGFGLEEPLNEEAYGVGLVIKGTHRILFGSLNNNGPNVDDLTSSERMARSARRWEMEPWLFFTSGDKVNRRKWQNVRNKRYSALRLHGLPPHIHILTLEPWKAGSVLLRLENTLETTKRGRLKSGSESVEDPKSHITVDLRKIFLHHKIRQVRETTLAANQWLEDARQMDWSTRYVYTGGDDGMLPEDLPGDENKSVKLVDNNNSDEESNYSRKYRNRMVINRNRNRLRINNDNPYIYDRKKRAVNETFNINDNIIINDTKDFKFEFEINEPAEIPVVNFTKSTAEHVKDFNSTVKKIKSSRVMPKLSFWNKPKVSGTRMPFLDIEEDELSSEEDFSSLKKRSPKKNAKNTKKNKEEIIIDDSDDGVTRSMYEMYYKPLPPRNPYRRVKHSGDVSNRKKKRRMNIKVVTERAKKEQTRRRNSKRRYTSDRSYMNNRRRNRSQRETKDDMDRDEDFPVDEEPTRQKSQHRRGVNASTKTTKRSVYYDYYEDKYGDYDYDDDDDDDYYDDEKTINSYRRKRNLFKTDAVDSSEQDQGDQDFKVTLRPTQIRTFVIWFVNTKKNYNEK